MQRLNSIRDLVEDGKSNTDIAKELNLPIATVSRNIKYLEELQVSDLSAEEVAQKRSEIYLELLEISEESKKQYKKYLIDDKPSVARGFMYSWMKALEMRAKLYGLDNNVTSITNINNQQVNVGTVEKVSSSAKERIANIIKNNHEEKVLNKLQEDE